MKPRIVLFGTPDFAEEAFKPILADARYDVCLIVTQPDKPSGRGLELLPSPVKKLAGQARIPIAQPVSLRGLELAGGVLRSDNPKSQELADLLNAIAPIDLFVVVAYGKIIPEALLNFPRLGAINVHGSLLPRWRGAAPIHRALAAGDTETGVCLMQLDPGLDTGPVFSEVRTPILPADNFGTLHDRLARLGGELLAKDLPAILDASIQSKPQPETGATHADKWTVQDLTLNWNAKPDVILNTIRASAPQPGARSTLKGELIKIFQAELKEGPIHQKDQSGAINDTAPPGTVLQLSDTEITVQLEESFQLLIRELQLAGRKRLPAGSVVRGRAIAEGDRFGT